MPANSRWDLIRRLRVKQVACVDMRTAKLVSAVLRLLFAHVSEGREMLAEGARTCMRLRGVRHTESLVWEIQQVLTTGGQESLWHKIW